MTGAENSVDLVEAVTRLSSPFFEQGGDVWVGRCCHFVYVGVRAADLCGSCKKPVACLKVATPEAARAWASTLPPP